MNRSSFQVEYEDSIKNCKSCVSNLSHHIYKLGKIIITKFFISIRYENNNDNSIRLYEINNYNSISN